ncbi:MFS transporter [Parvularcula sp. LCG005]|uniref:MFS transporter n=1 Tax=Parvularcula sp. LCG005 TaxID=3078805 RepID=UPI00294281E6|nr:MFS transporter [Parvularcula sp. LCG005]WOI53069.1 MFS transporter [Parvularcula sp. LCG005]
MTTSTSDMAAADDVETPPSTRLQRTAVLTASILGSSMAFVNGTAVTLALDPIQTGLGATLSEVLWVASIYMLFISALMLIGGAIGDFYGRRAIYMTGVAGFVGASIMCALATSPEMLIAGRALQGVGAALLTPMSLTLLSDYFPKTSRGMAIGLWSLASAVMTAVGPPVGGWLAENASWRTIFLLPLPFGILALFIAWWFVPARKPARVPDRVDYWGAILAVIGFAGIAYGFITLSEPQAGHTALKWGAPIMIGLVALLALVVVERNVSCPMAPPSLFGIGTFNALNIITLLLYGAMGGIFVFYPIVLTDAYGFGMDEVGTAFLGFALPMIVITPLASRLLRRFGIRAMLALGSLVGVAAFGTMGLSPYAGTYWGVFLSISIFGAGIALVVPSMNMALFNTTPEDAHGVASGINNTCARAATLFAIAGYGAAASHQFYQVANPAVALLGYGAGDALTGANAQNYREAMISSFQTLAWISIALCFFGFLVAAFFIDGSIEKAPRPKKANPQPRTGVRRLFGASVDDSVRSED